MSKIAGAVSLTSAAVLCPHGWIAFPDAEQALVRGEAIRVAGGWAVATRVRVLQRQAASFDLPVAQMPEWLARISGAGAADTRMRWQRILSGPEPLPDFNLKKTSIMGILNVTPDSFSDGGRYAAPEQALAHAHVLQQQGADLIDIGGESTRPGAEPVSPEEEWARIGDVITALSPQVPVSVDTRHAATAQRAMVAGARWMNDVMAGREEKMLSVMAAASGPVVLMHCLGTPGTMQNDPRYSDVVLDVFDFLQARLEAAVQAGVQRARIVLDPGLGFGKTVAHNLDLIRHLSGFHGLGAPLLFGVSRKSLIGKLSPAEHPQDRCAGSVSLALEAVRQGCHVVRVHDVYETRQALNMYQALTTCHGDDPGPGV